jgi:hypothetical protein
LWPCDNQSLPHPTLPLILHFICSLSLLNGTFCDVYSLGRNLKNEIHPPNTLVFQWKFLFSRGGL